METDSKAGRRLIVMGQGYVGLPLSMAACHAGWDVVGFDPDEARVDSISVARSILEDLSDADLRAAIESGRYRVTSDPGEIIGFDVAVICVPTPLKESMPDLSYVDSACVYIGASLRPGCLVVLESTTYPGTTEARARPLLEELSGLAAGRDFYLGYSPERIDPGNAVWTIRNTPRIVSGVSQECLNRTRKFYESFVSKVLTVSTPSTAELVKILENTFRYVNIALVNEFAMLSHELGIEFSEVVEAAATKPYGFMSFRPGAGVGGHCLPVDPTYVNWLSRRELGRTVRFVDLADDVNSSMASYVADRIASALNGRGRPVLGSEILLLGMAYKRNSSDIRESSSFSVALALQRLGARVRCADPRIDSATLAPRYEFTEATRERAASSDVVVILVDHDDFDLRMIAESAPLVFDCTYSVQGDNVLRL